MRNVSLDAPQYPISGYIYFGGPIKDIYHLSLPPTLVIRSNSKPYRPSRQSIRTTQVKGS